MTEKIKITKVGARGSKITVKRLRFAIEGSNVEVPQLARITSIQRTSRFENGSAVENSADKISAEIVDEITAKQMEELGGDASDIKGFTLEVEAPESDLLAYDIEGWFNKTVSLKNAKIALEWASRGQSGSFGKLKLIVPELVLAEGKAK